MVKSRKIINDLLARFKWAVQRHGVMGMLRLGAEHIEEFAIQWRPSIRTELRLRKHRDEAFDKQFGVDTAGCIHPTKLNINSPNRLHAVSYGGSDPKTFRAAIEALSIDYRRFIFIDFGSGKGRAILMATEFPFKRIVGIEFSEELNRIAQENINRFHRSISKCTDVVSVCMDVVDYTLPDDRLVCYLCNPFDTTIMTQVLSNIRESFYKKPREIFVIYYNPKEGHLFDNFNCFKEVGLSGTTRIWRTMLKSQESKE